jgi:hypothetical protein
MEWYYLDNEDKQIGPLADADLQEAIVKGTVKRETMVWNEGMAAWLPAESSSAKSHFNAVASQSPNTTTPRNPPPSPLPAISAAAGFGRDDSLVYPTNPPRSPNLAWLSLLGPGLAQIVFGKTSMGISGIVTSNLIFFLINFWENLIILYPVLLTVTIVDGYMTGNRFKEGVPVGKWQFFPRNKTR